MDEQVKQKLEIFFSQGKAETYKKGEILIRADDQPRGIFFLKRGAVKMYAISAKGEEIVLTIFKPESFFPMTWAINESPNAYYFEAVTDADVSRVSKDTVTSFIKSNPDVLYDLLSRVYKGMDGMLTRMTYLMSGNAYTRLVTELLIHARRFGTNDRGTGYYTLQTTEKDLAALSGLTRETVSREMKQLKDKKLVTFVKNVLTISDIAALQAELTAEL